MSGYIVILAFLVLFVLGFPVVLAIGIPSVIYLLLNDLPLQMMAQRSLYALDSFPLVAVPVFIFVGSLMNGAGISKVIYRFADTAVGRLPGGLAQVNIFGSLVFAGMSGSGATCFALYAPDGKTAQAAKAQITARHPEWWAMDGRLS
jgi:TRAP-type mannitol/chloroaromatic compound transport system permease large subunit